MHQDDSVTAVGPHPTPTTTRTGVCWGSIFAGTFIAVGAWLLLHLLGMGIGLIALEPNEPNSLRGVGIGTGVWALIAPLLGLFIGGLAVGRLGGPLDRASSAIHGAVLWALTTVATITLLWMALTAVIGGAVAAGTSMATATTGGAAAALGQAPELSPESLGLSTQDLLAPINRRLQAEGKPALTGEELMNAARNAMRTSVREGRLDRQLIVDALAQNTPLSPAEAADIAGSLEQRYDARVAELGEAARTKAIQAAEGTGKALLGLSLTMLLGLAAAVGGALLGTYREERRSVRVRTYPRVD